MDRNRCSRWTETRSWLALALRRLRFPRHETGGARTVRGTWSSGTGARGGERGGTSTSLAGRRSSTFDHAIDSRPAATDAPAGYAREVLRRVVSGHAAEVRHCYETALVNHPGMEGTLTLAFTITADGSVARVTADDDQPHVAALTECFPLSPT